MVLHIYIWFINFKFSDDTCRCSMDNSLLFFHWTREPARKKLYTRAFLKKGKNFVHCVFCCTRNFLWRAVFPS